MPDIAAISESEILADVLSAAEGDFPPEVAEAVLRLGFSEDAVDRMNDLAARNAEGELSDAERDELDKYVRVGTFVNLLQAKARLSLQSAG